MSNIDAHIKSVSDKLQQLLKNYALLQKENETIKIENKQLKEEKKSHKTSIDELQQKINVLKAAVGQMPENEKKDFERRINQYVRDIDKAITLLNE